MKRDEFTLETILIAYINGYFPMPDSSNGEILWYRPDPRAIIPLQDFKISRSLARSIRNRNYTCSFDQHFKTIINGCAKRQETWINDVMIDRYCGLRDLGFAHSVEINLEDQIVGGLYGLSIGGAFFAESMFSIARDASKVALFYLVERLKERGFELLEVQFMTPHLRSLGAIEVSDTKYLDILQRALKVKTDFI